LLGWLAGKRAATTSHQQYSPYMATAKQATEGAITRGGGSQPTNQKHKNGSSSRKNDNGETDGTTYSSAQAHNPIVPRGREVT